MAGKIGSPTMPTAAKPPAMPEPITEVLGLDCNAAAAIAAHSLVDCTANSHTDT
ncbi:hypothetical protein [Dickeya undicola]|uniref:hypothetical protein n=1 Tax=Dickeya undicola TaxID=1577887 RepID=UPI000B0E5D77|nr:hypothetical protein [Dickeya undicola]